jgi:hypothetical protein
MKDPKDFITIADELHTGKISFEQALEMTW